MSLEYMGQYKMARAMVAGNQWEAAITLLQELLEAPRAQISSHDMKHDLAQCYLNTGRLDEAGKVLQELQEVAVLQRDHFENALILKDMGSLEIKRKKPWVAIYHLQKALDELAKVEGEDKEVKASMYTLLGKANAALGSIADAKMYYEQASELSRTRGDMRALADVYLHLSKTHQQLKNPVKAAEYSDRAYSLFVELENKLMIAKSQLDLAVLYGQIGNRAEALQLFEDSIARFHELGDRTQEGKAYVELAKFHAEEKKGAEMEEAVYMCQMGRQLLPELHPYQGWVSRVLAKVALHRGNQDEAIHRLQMAADCFKQTGELAAWDETMYELSKLYLERDNCTQAYHIIEATRAHTRSVLDERGIVL